MKERTDTLRTACKDFEEDLVLYYYGDDSEAERSRVEGHLQSCASCHAFLDDLRKLLPQMVKPTDLPQSFWITTIEKWSKSWPFRKSVSIGGGICWRPCEGGCYLLSEPPLLQHWRSV